MGHIVNDKLEIRKESIIIFDDGLENSEISKKTMKKIVDILVKNPGYLEEGYIFSNIQKDEPKKDIKKYAELLMSMSADFLGGGITEETYLQNLRLISSQIIVQYKIILK